ncbi:MAG TPA: response regulator [Bacteroidia bacterium]|nr:response regulator [Bacteroidia bacterium]
MKILLVEDEPFMMEAMSHVIRNRGNEVLAVNNVREAKELLAKETIGLVITDLYLPEPDGYGLVNHIKNNPNTKSIPVIVITGMVDHKETLSTKVPADEWVTKPFSLQQLTETIKKYLTIEV